jgi:DNA invertase Pin-like site-specific DNA recombinase
MLLENQRIAMKAYIDALPQPPIELHVTGSSCKRQSPDLQQLLSDIRQRKWDEVALYSVCLSGRDHAFDIELWRTCARTGCVLRYVANGISSDAPNAKVIFEVISSLAQCDREDVSARTKAGLARARAHYAANGKKWPGGKGKGMLSQKTLNNLKTIRGLLAQNYSVREIAQATQSSFHTIINIKRMSGAEYRRYVRHGNPPKSGVPALSRRERGKR